MNLLSLPIWAYLVWLALLGGLLIWRRRVSPRPLFWFEAFRRFLWTLLAAWAGALMVLLWASLVFPATHESRTPLVLIVLAFTAYAWWFFILPLALVFEDHSRIYRLRFSVPLGVVLSLVAYLIYDVAIDLAMHRPISGFKLFQTFPLAITFPLLFGLSVSVTMSALAAFAWRPRKSSEDLAATSQDGISMPDINNLK
jgi:hypothetical protein